MLAGSRSDGTPGLILWCSAVASRSMSDELRNKIGEVASGPKRVRTDAGEVEAQDVAAMIEADKYLSAKAASTGTNKRRGLRFNKLLPPGTI